MATIKSFQDTEKKPEGTKPDAFEWNDFYGPRLDTSEHQEYVDYLAMGLRKTIADCEAAFLKIVNQIYPANRNVFEIAAANPPKKPINLTNGIEYLKNLLKPINKNTKLLKSAKDNIAIIRKSLENLEQIYDECVEEIHDCYHGTVMLDVYRNNLEAGINSLNLLREYYVDFVGEEIKPPSKNMSLKNKPVGISELLSTLQYHLTFNHTYKYKINETRLKKIIDDIISENRVNNQIVEDANVEAKKRKYDPALIEEIIYRVYNDIPSTDAAKILAFKNSDDFYIFIEYILEVRSYGYVIAKRLRRKPNSDIKFLGKMHILDYLDKYHNSKKVRAKGKGRPNYHFTRIMIDDLWTIKNDELAWEQFKEYKRLQKFADRTYRTDIDFIVPIDVIRTRLQEAKAKAEKEKGN